MRRALGVSLSRDGSVCVKGENRGPKPVDVIVGSRVRVARLQREMSQATLAQRLGISFQQVQKYERGSNRMSASTLVAIATLLGVSPGSLLEGMEPGQAGALDVSALGAPGVHDLVAAYAKLPEPQQRAMVRLVRSLASMGDGED
jgi:transcriptional regulator with XRE-family HTH domain